MTLCGKCKKLWLTLPYFDLIQLLFKFPTLLQLPAREISITINLFIV